jgi:hypothetical protein
MENTNETDIYRYCYKRFKNGFFDELWVIFNIFEKINEVKRENII